MYAGLPRRGMIAATMDSEFREDPVTRRRLTAAALLLSAAMLLVGGSAAWTIFAAKGKPGVASDTASLFVCGSVLLVLVATVNVFRAYGKLRWSYRCPQCRERLPRVPKSEVGSRICYRCAACNVDWDTGWVERGKDAAWD